ncbi:LOW QUALITY PROTEIN: hypothetical protein PHMEG_00034439, partial [Phytophthora megakarya]
MARIRSSPRGMAATNAAANAATIANNAVIARDIDFRHFWRQLRAAGWTAKKPNGLQTEWSYSSLDGSNVFVGEDAVAEFALKTAIMEETRESDDEEDAPSESSSDEQVRASQIDTTYVKDLFGSSSESDTCLSQSAVARAFDLPPEGLLQDASQLEVAAAGLQLLSGASGAESRADEDNEPPADESRRPGSLWLAKPDEDVNFVPDNEGTEVYESFSSEESDGVAYKEEDEDGQAHVESDDTEDVISDGDAVEMGETFIASLYDTPDRGSLRQRQDALRAMKWTATSSSFDEDDVQAYPCLAMENAQQCSELRAISHSPLLPFFYFMSKSMWVLITQETNLYELQQVDRRAQAIHTRQSKQSDRRQEKLKNIRRRSKTKTEYHLHEILHVVAHWPLVEDGAVPAGNFGRFMSRNRCHDVLRDLHFVDYHGERTRDKLWKLRPVIMKLQQRFLAGWTLPA